MTSVRFHQRTMVVVDEVMQKSLELASRAAKSRAPVLVCGESGTGKELLARFIHEKSDRSKGPFVSVNCAAIPEGLLEAELFGFERGAFTGAVLQRLGKFERASGGTILLDEISEMPIALQAKLLRVLQEGEVDRLGARDPIAIDTRVIATTNRDPRHLVRDGEFRADLFYRLNVIRIECAPLRGRDLAILSLAEEFLKQRGELRLSTSAKQKLMTHNWPGNIRELQNAVERAVLLSDGQILEAKHFDLYEEESTVAGETTTLATVEQTHILRTLSEVGGNRNETAKRLGISVRTLRNKLNQYSDS